MENLIVIEGKEKYKYNDIESLIKGFINERYYNMSETEQKNELEKKAIANTIQDNIKIYNMGSKVQNYDKEAFIVYDEITYILSMLKFNKIILLEKTNANIFGKYINKENITDNYIIVNKFANEIIQKYLENN
ncbi:MAG: hypothetical protein HXK66_05320 [Clostridiales bacterium]|jgi:hypothetical protein|nr:hypothetical protein [Clostridiales bacterium]MBF0979558.1 hypothetical protein [Clostridiales bacterium]MBF0986659.1 hypothetical protein [Clostridiales bacterium]